MVDRTPPKPPADEDSAAPPPAGAIPGPRAYEAPVLVEIGTLRDLTASGSFGDPT